MFVVVQERLLIRYVFQSADKRLTRLFGPYNFFEANQMFGEPCWHHPLSIRLAVRRLLDLSEVRPGEYCHRNCVLSAFPYSTCCAKDAGLELLVSKKYQVLLHSWVRQLLPARVSFGRIVRSPWTLPGCDFGTLRGYAVSWTNP